MSGAEPFIAYAIEQAAQQAVWYAGSKALNKAAKKAKEYNQSLREVSDDKTPYQNSRAVYWQRRDAYYEKRRAYWKQQGW